VASFVLRVFSEGDERGERGLVIEYNDFYEYPHENKMGENKNKQNNKPNKITTQK